LLVHVRAQAEAHKHTKLASVGRDEAIGAGTEPSVNVGDLPTCEGGAELKAVDGDLPSAAATPQVHASRLRPRP
jgi:hypothetical protein